MTQVLLFSLTAMANPTLVAATTVMLLLPSPKKLMLGYLLGALMTSITIGLVIVFALENDSTRTAKHTINPMADFVVGGILIVISVVLATGSGRRFKERRREGKGPKKEKQPARWQRELAKGSPRVTFVVGALLTLPGASYLAALTSLDRLNYSTGATVLLVVMINVIMLALIELPLICFVVAPDWTPRAIERTKGWFARNGHTIAVSGTAVIGSLLILRGIVTWGS